MGHIVAITGGIGSGKSVVSRIVAVMGMMVYDCDSRAKRLMDTSEEIKRRIASEISEDCITDDNRIDRPRLSKCVFNDIAALTTLNKIVHGAVREDFRLWCCRYAAEHVLFVETAILYQSGMDSMVDEVWEVSASEPVRIARVMERNNLSASEVKARIMSQDAYVPVRKHPHVVHIDNNGDVALLPQILKAVADC